MGLANPNAWILGRDLADRRIEAFFLGDSFLTPGNAYTRPATNLVKIAGGLNGRYSVRRWCITPTTSSAPMTFAFISASPDWKPVDNLGELRNENALYVVDSENRWSLPCSLVQWQSNTGANWLLNGFLASVQMTPSGYMGKATHVREFGADGKAIARVLFFGHPSAEIWNRTMNIRNNDASGGAGNVLLTAFDPLTNALGTYQDGTGGARSANGNYREDRLNAIDTDLVLTKATNDYRVSIFDSARFGSGAAAHGLTDDRRFSINVVWQDADASGNALVGNGLYVAAGASWGLTGFSANAASSGSTTSLKRYPRQQLTDFVDLSIYDRNCVAWYVLSVDWNEEYTDLNTNGETAYRTKIAAFLTEIAEVNKAVGLEYRVAFMLPYYHFDAAGAAVGGGTDAQAKAIFRRIAGIYADFCKDNVCMVNAAEFTDYTMFDGSAGANAKLTALGYSAWNVGGTYGGGDGIINVTTDWTSADSTDVAADGDLMDSLGLHPNGLTNTDKDEQISGMVFADLFRRTRDASPDVPRVARSRTRSR